MAKKRITFSEFLKQLIEDSKLSQNGFAEKIDASSSTITGYLKGKEPTIEFLRKLVKYSKYDLITLLRIAYPDDLPAPELSPQTLALARDIEKLPQSVQDFIFTAVRNLPDSDSNQ